MDKIIGIDYMDTLASAIMVATVVNYRCKIVMESTTLSRTLSGIALK